MLDYRNTPTEGMNSSPSQRLMSHRTRTLVPVVSALLYPKVITDVKEKLQVKRRMANSYHDRTSKTLPPLEVGQEVRVASQKNKAQDSGKCLEHLSDRSYLVRVNGEVKCRDRVALRPMLDRGMITNSSIIPDESYSKCATSVGESKSLTTSGESKSLATSSESKSAATLNKEEVSSHITTKSASKKELHLTESRDLSRTTQNLERSSQKVVRTRTRIIKAPERYGNYVS